MPDLVAEFSAWNDVGLREAFTQACTDVSEQGPVSVVDAMLAKSDIRADVALAVYAADQSAIFGEPCTGALQELVSRQVEDIRMALGVAATGTASAADAIDLALSLGAPPPGAIREVVAAAGPSELYEYIIRWLQVVIAARSASSGSDLTLAQDSAETISHNLPTSSVSPGNPYKLRQRP